MKIYIQKTLLYSLITVFAAQFAINLFIADFKISTGIICFSVLHAPTVEKIEVVRRGKVRRAKLYYLRDRVGKSAKVKERI